MKTREREKDSRDSILLMLLILLVGFICIIVSSGWALRFAPSWKLPADMKSNLNPDNDFLTSRPSGFYEPIDQSILTPPDWINVFLTPGSTFLTRTPQPTHPQASNTPAITQTTAPIFTATTAPTNVVATTNTLIYFPPPPATSTSTKKPKPTAPTATPISISTPTFTPTATTVPVLLTDLGITKTDNATDYAPNIPVQYIIVANNSGPNNVTGATVTDAFSANLDPLSISWTCSGSGGATCTAGGTGNINDVAVNLPVGSSVQYTINATAIGTPNGSLSNTATITIPSGMSDPNLANNSANDTDQLAASLPSTIGNVKSGSYVDYAFATPFVLGPSSYLVYYPQNSAPPPSLGMDVVILQIGDGKNWYTVFTWGDGIPDINTDINPTDCPSETDNCLITLPPTNPPGITVNLNGVVPNSTYYFIRIISPAGPPPAPPLTQADSGDGVDINSIAVFP